MTAIRVRGKDVGKLCRLVNGYMEASKGGQVLVMPFNEDIEVVVTDLPKEKDNG